MAAKRQRIGRFGWLVALALALLAFAAGSASAGTYSVYSCVGPSNEALPNQSWSQVVDLGAAHVSHFTFSSTCGDLSVETISPSPTMAPNDGARYVFVAPADTTISGYSLNRALSVSFPSVGTPQPMTAAVREVSGSGTSEFGCVAVTADCSVVAGVLAHDSLALTQLSVGISCVDSVNCAGGSWSTLKSTLQDARVDLTDTLAPSLAISGGSLPGSTAAGGPQTLDVSASDSGGGVAGVKLAIDGAAADQYAPGGSCTQPYVDAQPCPLSVIHSFNIDTSTLAPGVHSAAVWAVDAAGNLSSTSFSTFFVTAPPAPPAPPVGPVPENGSPAVSQPAAKLRARRIDVRSSRRATVAGTLRTPEGAPIAGARLELVSLDLAVFGAKQRTVAQLTTDSAGRFSRSVPVRGAQRFNVLFRPYPAAGAQDLGATVVIGRLGLSLRASQRRVKPGGRLALRGTLTGAGGAARGTPVEIDARIRGRWRAVGVVDTRANGRFTWNYRFVRVQDPTRFTFRAQVRQTPAWPWRTKSSRRVRVLVAP